MVRMVMRPLENRVRVKGRRVIVLILRRSIIRNKIKVLLKRKRKIKMGVFHLRPSLTLETIMTVFSRSY